MDNADFQAIEETVAESKLRDLTIIALEIALQDAENDKQKRSAEISRIRVLTCGGWRRSTDPQIGHSKLTHWYCDVWTECPTCRQRRASKFKKEAVQHLEGGYETRYERFSDETEVAEFCRDLGDKSNYKRLPQQDGTFIVMFDQDASTEGEKLTKENIDSIDWYEIVNTPKGKRLTGDYMKPTAGTEKRKDTAIVIEEQPVFGKNVPQNAIFHADELVMEKTHYYNPKTAEEVERCIALRQEMFVEILELWGFDLKFTVFITHKVEINRIRWFKQDKRYYKLTPEQQKAWKKPPNW